MSEIASLCDLPILSGDDTLTRPLMSIGAVGVISVVANLAPDAVVMMVKYALHGDFPSAHKEHRRLFSLFKSMSLDAKTVVMKRALELVGRIATSDVRLPLVKMSAENDAVLKSVIKASSVIAVKDKDAF